MLDTQEPSLYFLPIHILQYRVALHSPDDNPAFSECYATLSQPLFGMWMQYYVDVYMTTALTIVASYTVHCSSSVSISRCLQEYRSPICLQQLCLIVVRAEPSVEHNSGRTTLAICSELTSMCKGSKFNTVINCAI